MIIAAYGASTARLASADSLHCNVACGSAMVSDRFRCKGTSSASSSWSSTASSSQTSTVVMKLRRADWRPRSQAEEDATAIQIAEKK